MIHVYPDLEDEKLHTQNEFCVCKPLVKTIHGHIVVEHSHLYPVSPKPKRTAVQIQDEHYIHDSMTDINKNRAWNNGDRPLHGKHGKLFAETEVLLYNQIDAGEM